MICPRSSSWQVPELDSTPGGVTVESVTTPVTASGEKEGVSVTHQVTSVPRNVILQIAGNVLKVLSPSTSLQRMYLLAVNAVIGETLVMSYFM